MLNESFRCVNDVDGEGFPAGGTVQGLGLRIRWQIGTLKNQETGEEVGPSGVFVEEVIDAALQRIQHYQEVANGHFRCRQNAIAITKLQEAVFWLRDRTEEREARGVKGTHEQ